MKTLFKLLLYTLAVVVSAKVIPGVEVDSYTTAFIVAIVLGILNMTLRPLLLFLTLPITVMTLGLFALVINTLMVLFASLLVPGFVVPGFFHALAFGIVLSLVGGFFQMLSKD